MTSQPDISAIILAAGLSSRMGEFKALMDLGRQTVLERMVSLYRQAGVVDVRVVAGHREGAIRDALSAHPVTVVHNPAYESGMYSSVLAGVDSLPASVCAFFVHPVDIPLVRPHSLAVLMEAFKPHNPPVAYPVFNRRRGHPPLIHATTKNAIAAYDGRGGLRALLQGFDAMAMDVPVADEGVLLDLDTPDDHLRLTARLESAGMLTDSECRALMEDVQRQPDAVCDHCRQVSRVAAALARAVIARADAIDIHLIESAARVHDVAKGRDDHAAAGAGLLSAMGFPAIAAIVATHMNMDVDENAPLDEAQIVYLADKLTSGITLENLQRRFDAKLEKYGGDPQVAALIRGRRQAAETIQGKIERLSGSTIDQLLAHAGIIP